MTTRSEWFGSITVAETPFAEHACRAVELLLAEVRPAELDRVRSAATFGETEVQIELRHVSGLDGSGVDLHYDEDTGGIFSPLGFEEYYRTGNGPPVELDVLDDLTVVLTSTYTIEETWWRGRRVRTVVTERNGSDDLGGSVSGWPQLPPPWLGRRLELVTRRRSLSYGGRRECE